MGSDDAKPNTKLDNILASVLFVVVQLVVIIVAAAADWKYSLKLDAISYGFFRDISLMIFFGFGFLMTFLYHHGLSAIGYCLMISAVAVELSLVAEYSFMHSISGHSELGITTMMDGLFCAAAVMISFGAVLGKVTPFQLLLMAVIEVFAFWANFRLATVENKAHDVGGGMVIHTFGAYFGLSVSYWVTRKQAIEHPGEKAIYSSDLFSLAGTIWLWVLWPSFQAAVAGDSQRQMLAVCNTFVSLCSSTIAFAIVSRLLSGHKFNVVHMQNATLAGGVAMGVAGDMDMGVHGAMISGFVAGAVSCFGYAKLSPLLTKLNIHDTCGVHNLHGMPGLISAIVAIVVTAMHDSKPGINGTKGFEGITAANQVYATLISLGMGLGCGTLAGVLMTLPWKRCGILLTEEYYYSDALFFEESAPVNEEASKIGV